MPITLLKKKQAATAEKSAETAPVEQTETTEGEPAPRKFEYDAPSISVSLERFLKVLDQQGVTYTTAIAEEYRGKPISIGLKNEDIVVFCGAFAFVFDTEEFDGKRWLKGLRPSMLKE